MNLRHKLFMLCSLVASFFLHSSHSFQYSLPSVSKVQRNQIRILSMTTSTAINSQKSKVLIRWKTMIDNATNLFPFWVLGSCILGTSRPQLYAPFQKFITPALSLTMICMGMSLKLSDFMAVYRMPQYVLLGFLAQYIIMPSMAFLITRYANLGPDLNAGIILVGCCPGGTASNLVTLIAKADVALSVVMTAVSTMAAVIMTPLLTTLLVGSEVKIKASELVYSTLQLVLLPVSTGLILNTYFPNLCSLAAQFTPLLCVMLVAMICGAIAAVNVTSIKSVASWPLLLAVITLHTGGFLFGYLASKLVGAGEDKCRTVSIETGMQNSALAAVLAGHFPNPAVSAIPGCLSATCHSVMGSILAAIWRSRNPTITTTTTK